MLEREFLRSDVSSRLFGPALPHGSVTLGLEVEFIPQRNSDHSVLPIFGTQGSLALLRAAAERSGWEEHTNVYGVPFFRVPSGGAITFEPGGQIEYSSPAFSSGTFVLSDVRAVADVLTQESCAADITLVTAGIDPYNGPESAALQLDTTRYSNMARHFAAIGPAGARMMRQTAAVQMNVGLGPQPLRRWRLLNAMVPALTAMFANSPRYAGKDTGYASYRAETWRKTDRARTGVFEGDRAVDAYLDFALGAAAILPPYGCAGVFRPFADVLSLASPEDWKAHLTTLFPDIRPKGHFEIRCIDGQPAERYGDVLAFVLGILLDARSSGDAEVLLPPVNSERVERAARLGLDDYEVCSVCEDLVELALAGCRRMPDVLEGEEVERAGDGLRLILNRARSSRAGAGYAARAQLLR